MIYYRFGTMHVFATNIIMWIGTLLKETIEALEEAEEHEEEKKEHHQTVNLLKFYHI
jgi:hypothetical protein